LKRRAWLAVVLIGATGCGLKFHARHDMQTAVDLSIRLGPPCWDSPTGPPATPAEPPAPPIMPE
jgi:hypothetical protein